MSRFECKSRVSVDHLGRHKGSRDLLLVLDTYIHTYIHTCIHERIRNRLKREQLSLVDITTVSAMCGK